jgi:soluble lytic murein transglycosylase-like protein
VLEAGRADGSFPNAEPRRHAQFIRALTWELVEERLSGATIEVAAAREEVLRFCLPALGVS